VGNTNKIEFLNDETGSVRFICFEMLDKIDFNYSKNIDVNDLYAQAYYLLQSGAFDYEVSNEDLNMIQEYNKRFFILTPEIQLLQKYYRKPTFKEEQDSTDKIFQHATATDILQELQKLTGIKINSNNIGKGLKFLNYKRIGIRSGKGTFYCYKVVPLYKKKVKEKNKPVSLLISEEEQNRHRVVC